MGQKPIAVRVKVNPSENADADSVVVSVGEAARCLGVSERTVFRLLKSGDLERAEAPPRTLSVNFDDSHIGVRNHPYDQISSSETRTGNFSGMANDSHTSDIKFRRQAEALARQVREKDEQITNLLKAQQDMTQTIARLQEQMYELAHLVLTHNAAAAQARAEAELKALERANDPARRGLSGLLGARKRS